ncbi:hypothetical protein HY523_02205 [Candidatus Berkelbacteria bacterium]|nr:hypothetical protein [Candidatus Berkelbacteria bacterium]
MDEQQISPVSPPSATPPPPLVEVTPPPIVPPATPPVTPATPSLNGEQSLPSHRIPLIIMLLVLFFLMIGGGVYFYAIGTDGQNQGEPNPTTTNYLPGLSDEEVSPSSTATSTAVTTSSSPAPTVTTPVATNTASNQTVKPSKTVVESGGFALTKKSAYSCSAQVPNGWSATGRQASDLMEITNPEKTMYAGYGILGINSYMSIYDPELYSEDPPTSVLRFATLLAQSNLTFADPDPGSMTYTSDYQEAVGDYTLRSVESPKYKGVVFYRIFPGDGYNNTYIEAMRFAITKKSLWPASGLLVAQVAASIDCTTQLQPRDTRPPSDATSSSSSSGAADKNGDDYGYNPQLGTEYAHNPNTGENYLVDPSQSWSETGPAGAGYYVPSGSSGDYTHLEPGRSD